MQNKGSNFFMGTLFLVDGKCDAESYQGARASRQGGGDKVSPANPINQPPLLRPQIKAAIFAPMHFSRHISQLHSTFSLLAALKLRVAR
jgi:hypothetical protein